MTGARILVIDGNVAEIRARQVAALAAFAADLRDLQVRPSNAPLLWKHALGPAMQSEALRLLEIRNWLDAEVMPHANCH